MAGLPGAHRPVGCCCTPAGHLSLLTSATLTRLLSDRQGLPLTFSQGLKMIGDMELVGVHEIAHRLGISRQRVYQLIAEHRDFPSPIANLHSGRVWKATDIDRWSSKRASGNVRPQRRA